MSQPPKSTILAPRARWVSLRMVFWVMYGLCGRGKSPIIAEAPYRTGVPLFAEALVGAAHVGGAQRHQPAGGRVETPGFMRGEPVALLVTDDRHDRTIIGAPQLAGAMDGIEPGVGQRIGFQCRNDAPQRLLAEGLHVLEAQDHAHAALGIADHCDRVMAGATLVIDAANATAGALAPPRRIRRHDVADPVVAGLLR